ncbi:MAG: bifunctional oligoribonuclease/PAP phosphatase NrnA [Anaerolineaceae bacterium]|nr:MAG: bifunctional oligoribonuclease/PAP phosphatase NrnA [Anaerolineaceae bacterium]
MTLEMLTPMINETHWQAAHDAIADASRIVVVTHVSPDGDAIGSMLGVANILRGMGKTVDCAVDGGVPPTFTFLPNADTIQPKLFKGEWDVFISTDSSDEARTGECGAYARANSRTVINLDHHATNTLFGDIHLVQSTVSSAAEVAFNWVEQMAVAFSPEVARPLLTGIVTDTIGFRTSNVTERTLAVAQTLIKSGASLTEITERALDNRSYQSVNLWKQALQSMELHEGGVLCVTITRDDFKQAGIYEDGDFGLAGFLVRVEEAMIAVVIKETEEDGQINVSMRAKPGFNVADTALELGGGGHLQASGATVEGTLADVKARTLALLVQAAKSGKRVIV